ncbi:MAG: hypothetical protein HUJ30_09665 [Gammaproteobacteria bacterium]|nr:hypothetical protein [Gammaproteobacteria bacterium]
MRSVLMMRPDEITRRRWMKNSMMLLLFGQVILVAYLLAMSAQNMVLFMVFSIIPIWLLCHLVSKRPVSEPYSEMGLVMFAAGGFGMLLGSLFDIGQLGPYALLSYCRDNSLSTIFFDSNKIVQFFSLMPWSFIGMILTGNLAMLLFDSMGMHRHMTFRQYIYIYLVCNIGMLMGMLVGEAAASMIDMSINGTVAAAMMLLLMIIGMTLGMLSLLYIMMNLMRMNVTINR